MNPSHHPPSFIRFTHFTRFTRFIRIIQVSEFLMFLPILKTVQDVAEAQLCAGCGVCAHLDPQQIKLVDDFDTGRRPMARQQTIQNTPAQRDAMAACPGATLTAPSTPRNINAQHRKLSKTWGPVLAVWEGHATDHDIRFAGSSGGAATALSLFAIQKENMAGVIHTAARDDLAHLNRTVFSTTRSELLERTGSRYAPASPAEGLHHAESAATPCMFVGKPCDVAAVTAAISRRPELHQKIGLTLAMFCAGAPSTRGTFKLLERLGIPKPENLKHLRYRGNGWPGRATAHYETHDGTTGTASMHYEEAWGDILQAHRPWRCHICPDHTGELADISVGDPWHHPAQPGDPGRSLIVARTPRGLAFVKAAQAAGYLTLSPANIADIAASQPHLQRVRAAVGLRLLACRLRGIRTPRFHGFFLAHNTWQHLSLKQKLRSFAGTWRRIKTRGLSHPRPVIAAPLDTSQKPTPPDTCPNATPSLSTPPSPCLATN